MMLWLVAATAFLGSSLTTMTTTIGTAEAFQAPIVAYPMRQSTTTTLFQSSSISSSSSSSKRSNRVQALLTWAKNMATIQVSPTLQLGDTPGAGLGFTATQTINSGNSEVLMQVPCDVALTVEVPGGGPNDGGQLERACRKSTVSPFRLETMPWYVQFSLYLYQLQNNNGNTNALDRRPWLDSLPTQYDTPIHWSPAQRAEWLDYDAMVQSVQRQEATWKQYYETVSKGAFPNLSYEQFLWGCETARSRAFSSSTAGRFNPQIYAFTLILVGVYVGLGLGTLEEAANGAGVVVSVTILKDFVWPKLFAKKQLYVICPVIDMANHNSLKANAQVSLEYFANAFSLSTNTGGAGQGVISKGSPVEISYGARSNDQLLQYYGFVEPDNPHDVYIMPPLRNWPLEIMEEACGRSVAGGRLEKLARAGLLGKEGDSDEDADDNISNPLGGVVITRTQGVDPAVIQALRALFSTPAEWDAAGEAVGNFATVVSAENEAAVQVAAKTALEWELSNKSTSLQQDRKQLERIQASSRSGSGKGSLEDQLMEKEEVLALQFRVEKKQLLADTIAAL